ncbi:hypothetical protein B0I37DRAFT_125908 [Chaetomium sp. MPI-CAGE-AT-0009]|nr:hypothetical protein B0I37DRAFT_125908 [Chaetomium sp. MPI-CAGE-AT-0009]
MASRWYSGVFMIFLLVGILSFILAINYASPLTGIIPRLPGGRFNQLGAVLDVCHGSDPAQFAYAQCSIFINCFLHNTSEVLKADMGIGTGLVGLLPTIFLLIAKPPMGLVQQGLIAPHRALAMACFSIGIPQQMFFDKLRPVLPGFWNYKGEESERTRVLEIPVPVVNTHPFGPFASRITADIVVLGCTGIMLWRTWVVSSWVMVPWRCEISILQFAWPIGCLFWMALVLPLLHVMADSIKFTNCLYDNIEYQWWQVLLLPYTQKLRRHIENETRELSAKQMDDMRCIRVEIRMPYTSGLRSWLVYDFVIGILGSALYFYGTFVWLSCVFLTAVPALTYAGVTAACYVTIILVNSLF